MTQRRFRGWRVVPDLSLENAAMAETKKLARLLAVASDDGAKLTIEAEDGETFEVDATFDQIELIADTLDEVLTANDDALEVTDEENA
jgi:hypothetical protein